MCCSENMSLKFMFLTDYQEKFAALQIKSLNTNPSEAPTRH